MLTLPRRRFLAGMAAMSAASAASCFTFAQSTSPFRVSVINDEISQDFAHACEVTSKEFGMHWIELRSMWNKNIVALDEKEVAETRRLLEKFQLKVTDIASPLFKVDWPGAPKSKYSEAKSFNADYNIDQQDEVLERAIALAKTLGTDRVRCFDFWRLDNQAPYRDAMNAKLRDAATKAEKQGMTLVLENEPACNTATAHEAVKVLNAVQSRSFMLNWDPGNAAASGETPYPDGYNLLPKDRIGHCHCKDTVRKGNRYDWAPMGGGMIDWASQFKALKRDGYHFAVSLETHWHGGGTPEESSRKSWAGMRKLLQEADAL
ncbi:MAG TPA: sugar phosphate isomerase/epimerase family protein [Candidatus Sulfotelmatobacter sp.]|nr:sugar phosphate isomerase/epimerase family protein [Candidatus Sulfotelmatobacter sp.]